MSVEDRVRAATHARAALVGDVRPLDLPAVPGRAPKGRRWVAWAAPVAAAVAVAAVAVSSPSCPSETCGQVRRAADGQAVLIAGINTGGNGPPFASAVFSQVTVRTIAADSPSGSLVARGKVVFRLPNGVGCNTVQLTSDEKTVLCGKHDGTTAKRSAAYAPKFVAYSVASGKSRLLHQLKGAYQLGLADVLRASPTGSTLLGAVYAATTWPRPGAKPDPVYQAVGLLINGTFKPVKFPLTAVPLAGEIAF